MTTQSFSVTSDTETMNRVRTITGYDDVPDELPQGVLTNLIDAAKAKIYSEAESTAWYSDHFMGEVLVYTLAVMSKLRVENYSVQKWSLGNESVTTLNANPEEEGQLMMWIDIINNNLEESDETEVGGSGVPELTSTFNW